MDYQIVKDGKSDFYIVTSAFAEYGELFGASELQKYIYKSTDVLVPYFSDRCKKRGREICIGLKARDIYKELDENELTSLGDEGFIIKTVGENIVISGNTARGTIYGVYSFLERFLGFRCFTKDVEKIDKKKQLVLQDIDIKETPDFEYREAYFRFAFDGDFAVKNKLNSNLAQIPIEKGGHVKWYNCHHSFIDLIPPKVYFEAHPEYYALVDGKRVSGQPCLSNPEVLKIAIEGVKKWIKDNPYCKVFSVAQNDNEDYCQCENCKKIDEREGSPSGSIIEFVNKVASEIKREYPDVLIHTFAYRYSKKAPKTLKPNDNVIVRLCNIECPRGKAFTDYDGTENESAMYSVGFMNNLKEWSKITSRLYVWDYAVNFRNYLQPFFPYKALVKNIREYKKFNVKGVLQQGNFSYGGGGALDDLKSYLIAKLLWNSSLNEDEIIDEFMQGVYGKGAPYLTEYAKLICLRQVELGIYDFPDKEYFTKEFISYCKGLFKKAKKKEKDKEIRKRIERENLSIDFVEICNILDDEKRAKAVDKFAKKVVFHKLTEIMERTNLYESFEFMRKGNFTKDRKEWCNLYYLVK